MALTESLRSTRLVGGGVTADADIGFQFADAALNAVDDIFLGIGYRFGLRNDRADLFLARWPGGQADVDDAAIRQPGKVVAQVIIRGYQSAGMAG
ncbi:hypothetical protein D3C71_1699220 [compost metagenome]